MSGDFGDSPSTEEREEAIAEFLSRTGAVGLLREAPPLKSHGCRFTEFDEKLSISSSTLSKRLDEACELQLLKIELESTDYGANSMYVLTGAGANLRSEMDQRGIFRIYDKIQTLEEELDESVEDLREWVPGGLFRSRDRQFEP